jgi:hypothetical protein
MFNPNERRPENAQSSKPAAFFILSPTVRQDRNRALAFDCRALPVRFLSLERAKTNLAELPR